MDGMLVIGMTLAAMALAVLLILQLRRRYGSSNGRDGAEGGFSHHGNDSCDGGGDGGGGD